MIEIACYSPLGVMGDHGFDDGENLLLLIAREGGNGFELAFELGLRPAFGALCAVADAEQVFDGDAQGLAKFGTRVEGM